MVWVKPLSSQYANVIKGKATITPKKRICYPQVKNLSLKWKLPQIRVNEGQLKTLIGTKRDKAFKALSAENNCT